MNPSYSIHPERRLVIVEYTDTATYEDWEACIEAVLTDPAWVPGYRILVDRMKAAPSRPDDARRMIAFVRSHEKDFRDTRWAIVSSEVAELGMVRMTQALSADVPGELEHFPNRTEALAWLLEDGHQVA